MMIEIGIHDIYKNYGYNKVLSGVSFEVMTGDKLALVGKNGSGKTCLFAIITGHEAPDRGTVSIRKGARVGHLAQIARLWPEGTTVEQVLRHAFDELAAMERQLREAEAQMADPAADLNALYERYTRLQDAFTTAGGYEMEEQFSRVSRGFKLEGLLGSAFNTLSGGEKTVVSLAAMVLGRPDILLLDEPTNHLDTDTLAWFEDYVREYKGTVLVISHDRWFLDRVATKTVLLARGTVEVYGGNYSFAMREQERLALLEFEDYKTQQKKIEAMQTAIRRFRDWGARGDNPAMYKKAKMLERRLAQMELLENPLAKGPGPRLALGGERFSKEVIRVEGLCLEVPGQVLAPQVWLTVYGGERLLLAGKNGSGKTTLIRALLAGGPQVYISPAARIGYIPQEIRFEDEGETVLRWFQAQCVLAEGAARQTLARYGFYGDGVFKRLKMLSGGEKVLLLLAVQVQQGNNLLVLDEPTNHIDIDTRETLEEALQDYGGTLLFVSHDQYFIQKIATRAVELRQGCLQDAEGRFYTRNDDSTQ